MGATGPGLVWRDATGAFVSPTTGLTNPSGIEVFYFDAQGLAWPLERENGQITALAFSSTLGITSVYYTATGCTGTPHISPPMPRFVFQVSGDSAYYLRPDALQTQAISGILSYKSGITTPTCTNNAFANPLPLVPLAAVTPSPALTPPALSFMGPLHLSPQ